MSMGSGWRNATLGCVAEILMGQSPPGSTVSEDGGLPLLNGPTEFGSHHPTPVQYTVDPRKQAREGDILFCVRGSTTGRMNWADQDYAIGRGIAAIRHMEDLTLQPFVRAVIESQLPDLLAQATGSTFPNVSAQQLRSIPFPSLSIKQQRRIAHILGTLDDKIELNRRMDATLEGMARVLFKSWFVDFEPVRAKMEGRWRRGESLPGMPTELYDLFPERLAPSEIGEAPEGWGLFSLKDIADLRRGTVSPLKEPDEFFEHYSIPAYDKGEHPAIDIGASIKSNKVIVPQGVVLLSKINPEISRVWIPYSPTGMSQVASTEFLPFMPKSGIGQGLLYCLFKSEGFRLMIGGLVTGTSRSHQRVHQKSLVECNAIVGEHSVFQQFDNIIAPMLTRTLTNRLGSQSIAALRDALLPGLVLGEVGV